MSGNVASQVGSGTLPFTRGILSPTQRGSQSGAEGVRTGIQVMIGNPEDLVAVDAWMPSGITVGTSNVVQVIGPHTNPLPRCREIALGNFTANTVIYVGPWDNIGKLIAEGIPMPLGASANAEPFTVRLPILHNNFIYAIATGGIANLRILVV